MENLSKLLIQNTEREFNENFIELVLVLVLTRKYPLRGYILGVLTHTTALDRLWGGDETLTMWF